MAVELVESSDGRTLEIQVTGKLTKEDYEHFVPRTEAMMEQGKIKILMTMHDFHGWAIGALWEDIKFDVKHFGDIERLAIVGDKQWEKGMAMFCKPFTTAKVQYFDISDIESARSWLAED
ncbi:MAG: STAS/SEC14 domain-containing protein [Pirellulales bacterium]|nr:STAS/SEC14 domain-containing protein [Pirellulales bacterium]